MNISKLHEMLFHDSEFLGMMRAIDAMRKTKEFAGANDEDLSKIAKSYVLMTYGALDHVFPSLHRHETCSWALFSLYAKRYLRIIDGETAEDYRARFEAEQPGLIDLRFANPDDFYVRGFDLFSAHVNETRAFFILSLLAFTIGMFMSVLAKSVIGLDLSVMTMFIFIYLCGMSALSAFVFGGMLFSFGRSYMRFRFI